MRRALAVLVLTAVAFVVSAIPSVAQQRVLNVYNWSDYIDPDGARGVHQGDRHQGPLRHLRHQRDAGDQAARRPVRLRRGGADRLFPRSGRSRPACSSRSTSRSCRTSCNLWPEISQRLANYDPGNEYAVNYMWGTTGIGYNVAKAREMLGGDGTIDSWDVVFKPEKLAKLQGLRRPHARFRRRHLAGRAALSRARSELERAGRFRRRPPSC